MGRGPTIASLATVDGDVVTHSPDGVSQECPFPLMEEDGIQREFVGQVKSRILKP